MTLFRRASLFHIYFLGMVVPNAPIFWDLFQGKLFNNVKCDIAEIEMMVL